MLITGGTGSFGHAVMKRFLDTDIKEIRIFSRDEKKQDDMRKLYKNDKLKFYIGDVRDLASAKNAMHGVDYIFHAAALKQVPSCEFFPLEAVKTNVLGTENILTGAIEMGVKKVICLSTDKAAYPINAMGISKALMEKVILASKNMGKIKEFREILKDMDIELVSMKEAGIDVDIEEYGRTFSENALIKARTISEMTGCVTLADDSGLEVDWLNKEPGVHSARFMGHDTPYEIKNQAIIDKLKGVIGSDRSARFVAVVAIAFPEGDEFAFRGTMEGIIGDKPLGENGFGYDPIFFLPEYQKSSAELSADEKNSISHRGKALKKVKEVFPILMKMR